MKRDRLKGVVWRGGAPPPAPRPPPAGGKTFKTLRIQLLHSIVSFDDVVKDHGTSGPLMRQFIHLFKLFD